MKSKSHKIHELFQPIVRNWIDQGKKRRRKKDVDLSFIQAIARGRVEGYRILLRLALIF